MRIYFRIQILLFIFSFMFCCFQVPLSQASDIEVKRNRANTNKNIVNRGTIGIITGGFSSTPLQIATDLSSVLDDRYNELRVLPIPGKGGIHNVRDLLYLKGIDLAIVNADILNLINKNSIFHDVKKHVKYITKLYDAEVHVVADNRFTRLEDLRGQRVNFTLRGSSADLIGRKIFHAKGISIVPEYFDEGLAIQKISSGDIAASVIISGKPVKSLADIGGKKKLRLLPISYNNEELLGYLPARFSSDDYPGLIEPNKKIPTIATSVIIAAYNWNPNHKRYKKVEKFVNAFFSNISELHQNARHSKWKDVNLNAKVLGWNRFKAASDWLNKPSERRSARGIKENKTNKKNINNVIAAETMNPQKEPILGYWKVGRGKQIVKFYNCGRSICLQSLDKKHGQPMLSRDVRRVYRHNYEAKIFDPRIELKYDGKIRFLSQNKIILKGCAVFVHCSSDIWTRIKVQKAVQQGMSDKM